MGGWSQAHGHPIAGHTPRMCVQRGVFTQRGAGACPPRTARTLPVCLVIPPWDPSRGYTRLWRSVGGTRGQYATSTSWIVAVCCSLCRLDRAVQMGPHFWGRTNFKHERIWTDTKSKSE